MWQVRLCPPPEIGWDDRDLPRGGFPLPFLPNAGYLPREDAARKGFRAER